VTRPGVLGLGDTLAEIGLITLDAHFDMRDTGEGLSNGNPVRALIEDGLPGANIAQVGLASFANSAAMHRDAVAAGNFIATMGDVRREGIDADRPGARSCRALRELVDRLRHRCDRPLSIARCAGGAARRDGGRRFLRRGASAGADRGCGSST
jgi:arginase family enzyme